MNASDRDRPREGALRGGFGMAVAATLHSPDFRERLDREMSRHCIAGEFRPSPMYICRGMAGINNQGHYIIARNPSMHKRNWDTILYGIAKDQNGYFTAAQARAAGLHQVRLVQLAQR